MTASQESILRNYLARTGAISDFQAIVEFVGWSEVTPDDERRQTLAEAHAYFLGYTDGYHAGQRPPVVDVGGPIR